MTTFIPPCQKVHQTIQTLDQEKLTHQHQEYQIKIQNVDHVPSENQKITNEPSSS